MSQSFVHINGRLLPLESASVPFHDHGMLYGDGAFEGIRTYNGKVFKLDEHLTRLYHSAQTLAIALPIDQSTMRAAVLELCKENDHRDGYIRLTITRGTGLGLDPSHIMTPANIYISAEQLALYPKDLYESGLTLVTVSTRLPSPDMFDPRVKCTGKYSNNIQAKMEANRAGAGEGLMLNQQGYVTECTGDNIFVIKDGVLRTPPPYCCGLMGITRNTVIELAGEAGLDVDQTMMSLYDVYNADECFLTGTGAEVIPAVAIDGRTLGTGKPGKLTRRVISLFRDHTRDSGAAF